MHIQNRVQAFEAAQTRSLDPLSGIDDLSLSLAPSSSDEEDVDMPPPPKQEHRPTKRVAKHKPYKRWAKELLSHAEELDLSTLPKSLETDWSAAAVPDGKRCLAVITNTPTGAFPAELAFVRLDRENKLKLISPVSLDRRDSRSQQY